ncbi:MAG TPA: hypothetical protein DEA85_01160, partial [Firmicutes bacterium]|nr:hypothetical protein [Bacillota bacterium]
LATRGRIASLGEEKPEMKGVKVFSGNNLLSLEIIPSLRFTTSLVILEMIIHRNQYFFCFGGAFHFVVISWWR